MEIKASWTDEKLLKELGDTEGYSARLIAEMLYNNKNIQYKQIEMYFDFEEGKRCKYYAMLLPPSLYNEDGFCIMANSLYDKNIMIDECLVAGSEAIDFIAKFLEKYGRKVTRKHNILFYPDIDEFNKDLRRIYG